MEEVKIDPNVEPEVTPKTEEPKAPVINMEDLIAKARSDEKNKLYPEIEKLKKEVEQKTEKINAYLISVAEKDELIKDLQKQVETAKEEGAKEMETAKTESVKELETKIKDLEAKLQGKETEFEQFKVQQELTAYKAEKLKEVDETVADMVDGNSKEAIDASIEKAKAFYEKVASKFGTATTATPAPTKAPLPKPQLNDVTGIFKNTSPEDVARMTPAQYAEFRKSIGMI